jgi:formylglycine-generating enzyme required for sulfatase activity
MVREVQDAVESLAKTVSHDQRPALYNEARGNFYFYGPTTVNISPQTVTELTASQRDEIFWSDAKLSGNIEAFEAYLAKYPEGQYTSLAKANITRLKNDIAPLVKESKPTNSPSQTDSATIKPSPLPPGTTFKDCPECPEMVVVPAGSFDMGGEASDELPIHRVTLKSFAIGKTEITQAQWKAVMGDYYYLPTPAGSEKRIIGCSDSNNENCPVNMISWADTKIFISKLNCITGKSYRLPSESEWEYSCRAGGRHKFCGGDEVDSIGWHGPFTMIRGSKAVAGKNPNAWGLYDMSGNVYEWTEDCWNSNYNGAPADGSAWTSSGDCSARVLRGGATNSWESHLNPGVRPSALIKNLKNPKVILLGGLAGFVGFRIAIDN